MGDGATGFQAEQLLQHAAWVRRVAAHLVVDAARADDVAQQTLLAALTQPPPRTVAPRAWLASVARSFARRTARSDERRARHESAAPPAPPSPPVHDVVARAQTQRALVDAVLALDEPYRTALLLRFFENRSPRAIAKETRAPVETVRTRLKRGLELLRARYVERRTQDWAFTLVSLIEPRLWSRVRRLVAAKSPAATVSVAGGIGFVGVLGVLGMSMKIQVAGAVVVVAAGAFTVAKLCEPEPLPPRDALAGAAHARDVRLATESAEGPARAPAEGATRAVDAAPKAERAPTPAKPETSPATLSLEGVVVNRRGERIDGAFVLLDESGEEGVGERLDALCVDVAALESKAAAGAGEGGPRIVRSADGRFRFDAVPRGAAVAIAAVHADEGVAPAEGVKTASDGPHEPLELVVVPGVVFMGAVTDEQGVPLANARVEVCRFEGDAHQSFTQSLNDATSGGDGRYRTLPFPYRSFTLTAGAPGYLRRELGRIVVPENEREHVADFRLARAATWRGRIVTADGAEARLASVPGELVIAATRIDPRGKANSFQSAEDRGTLLRDEDRYEITPANAAMQFVALWCGGELLGAVELGDAAHAPDLVVDVAKARAARKGALVVEVVAARDGAPIADFELSWKRDPLEEIQSGFEFEKRKCSDAKGRASVEGLEVGRYHVVVAAAGFASRVVDVAVVAAPVAARIELPDVGRERLTGRVDDELGHPVASVNVYLLGSDGRPPLAWEACARKTDAAGLFRFDALQPGDYVLAVESPEGQAPAARPVTVKARRADAEATPADPAAVDVVVNLASGVLVQVSPIGRDVHVEGPFTFRIRDERGIAVHDGHRGNSLTTTTGTGAIPFRLAPGNYVVEVHCPSFVTGTVRFTATHDAHVKVEMVPLDAAGN